MKYSLIIKAQYAFQARTSIINKLPTVIIEDIERLEDYDQVLVEIESEQDLANDLNLWFTEERNTPYPFGALLYWREM